MVNFSKDLKLECNSGMSTGYTKNAALFSSLLLRCQLSSINSDHCYREPTSRESTKSLVVINLHPANSQKS